MNFTSRSSGTLKHTGSGKDWNRFDFTPREGGPVVRLHNIMAMHTGDLDHSRAAFALLGILTAFPEVEVQMARCTGAGDLVVELQCLPPHSCEIPCPLPTPKTVPKTDESVEAWRTGQGGAALCVQPLEFDEMPIYRFQAFVRGA